MSSSSSCIDDSYFIDTLTSQELSRLLTDTNYIPALEHAFQQESTTMTILQSYNFLSLTINTLEQDLERHQLEREHLLSRLMKDRQFTKNIPPLLRNFRDPHSLQRRKHQSPYERPSSRTPHSTPRSTTMTLHIVNDPPSLGSIDNPIVIDDENEIHTH